MEIVAIMLLGAIVNGLVASSRGRSAVVWVLVGACFPLISLLALILMPDVKQQQSLSEQLADAQHKQRLAELQLTTDLKTCPRCAERVKQAAVVCRFCGHEFRPEETAESPYPSVAARDIFITADGFYVASLMDGRAIAFVDGDYRLLSGMAEVRQLRHDHSDAYVEATDDQVNHFYREAAPYFSSNLLNGSRIVPSS